jgi:lysophospholipid acyltransferase (LPLAT)-like uncharacterized protein
MGGWKRLREAPWVTASAGALVAQYLRLVWRTNTFVWEPHDLYDHVAPDLPAIVTMWHGQHFMAPFLRRSEHRVKALISSHRDAEINAIAAKRLGTESIRGSGAPSREFVRKRGVPAFLEMRAALDDGWIVMMTADVPKVARVAGRGIVLLAAASGRPILPFGIATSRRIELRNWDRSAVNLPFGRGAMVLGDIVRVPPDADEQAMEEYRRAVEASLNAATARAYELVDAPSGKVARA